MVILRVVKISFGRKNIFAFVNNFHEAKLYLQRILFLVEPRNENKETNMPAISGHRCIQRIFAIWNVYFR